MYTIQKHLQYNAWANHKIAEILTGVDDEFFDKEVKSSFPSLRKTVLHIWDAEQIWFTRLKGGETKAWPSEGFKGNNKELLSSFVSDTMQITGFVANKDRAYLDSIIHYKNMKGLEFSQPAEDILFHVVNHGTYHRGQLITMLRQLGFEKFPVLDLIAYLRLNT